MNVYLQNGILSLRSTTIGSGEDGTVLLIGVSTQEFELKIITVLAVPSKSR